MRSNHAHRSETWRSALLATVQFVILAGLFAAIVLLLGMDG